MSFEKDYDREFVRLVRASRMQLIGYVVTLAACISVVAKMLTQPRQNTYRAGAFVVDVASAAIHINHRVIAAVETPEVVATQAAVTHDAQDLTQSMASGECRA